MNKTHRAGSILSLLLAAMSTMQVSVATAQSSPSSVATTPVAAEASAPSVAILAPTSTAKGPFLQRTDVRNFITEMNTRLGLPVSDLEQALGSVQPIPQVIDLIKPPSNPGVRSWQRYRSRFLDQIRIAGGKRFMADHIETLLAAEKQFGVPKEIIVSIIGVETVYGRNTGSFNTVAALATLAFDYPPRADLFRRELESLFLLAREKGVNALDFKGSYAGAIGLPQFLPSSIRAFAIDFDKDGVIDLRNSPIDAIGSVASYMAQNGWQRGGRIALRATLAPGADINPLLAAGLLPSFSATTLSQAGVTAASANQTAEEPAALIDLVTPGQATEYWLGLQNFYVITRYNRSSFYAMAVNDLAEAIAGPAPTATAAHARKRVVTHHR